jgi:histidyl-tRNA synthetase
MRDFYPDDMARQDRLFDIWRTSAERFGFQHYDACVVESLELLTRKAGEEITRQIYAFEDKSGRNLALRPEMTPTLARMVAARQSMLGSPLKWYTMAQCFRYERMTRGRKREHYQWNLDIVGETAVTAEAEVIATAVDALRALGLGPGDIVVLFSSRALLSDLLIRLGIAEEHHAATFLALDKRGKMSDEEITELLTAGGLDCTTVSNVFDLMSIQSIEDARGVLKEDTPAVRRVLEFVDILDVQGIADAVRFDISVIRGLAYYTGIVFEAFDAKRKFRAVFGGGRYDDLLSQVGGKPMPGVGLGFGDVVIEEILADRGQTLESRTADVYVAYMQAEQRDTAIRVANALRQRGQTVAMALTPDRKAKRVFSQADKGGYGEAVYIGPDDVAAGAIRIKDLASREEKTVRVDELIQTGVMMNSRTLNAED